MSADDIATIISAVGDSWPAALALIAAVIAFVAWKALPYLKDIRGVLGEVHHEVHNNSGTSMKDAVDRIEARLDEHIEIARVDSERLAALEARWGD